jgi:predicted dehydrogenase
MSTTPLRVGIVGAGANTRSRHIPGLRAIDGVEIVGVANRTPASSARAAAELGIPRAYDNWLELVGDERVDAVCIGTWPNLHCPVTLAALEAGKHVLCEARMAMNGAEARVMYDAARARPDLVAQVVPAPHTLGVDGTIQRLIADGFLGRVLAVQVVEGGAFLDPEHPLHWREDADRSGVNVMSLGIWYECVMRWVGPARHVTAMARTFTPMRRDDDAGGVPRAVTVPEHIDVLADLSCGAQLHIQISRVTGHSGPAHASLYGERGTIRFTGGKLLVGGRDDQALREMPIPPAEQGRWRVEEEFVAAVRGQGLITHTTFADGVKYMDFTEAATRSAAAGGQGIELPPGA